jgi:hypothetical protein
VNDLHSLEPNKIVEFIRFSIELFDEPIGVFLFFCTVIVVCISIITWPKKHVIIFFISFPMLFLGITIAFYHNTTNSIPNNPIEYMEEIILMIPFGIGYSIIYILLYWLSVGIAFLCSQQAELTATTKCVLCIVNSIILWIISKLWLSIATYITLFIYMIFNIEIF